MTLRLFAPVIGMKALPPSIVTWAFACYVLSAWLQILKKSTGEYARVAPAKHQGQTMIGPSAQQLLAADRRPPILYLRSFEGERSKSTAIGRFGYIQGGGRGFYLLARRPTSSRDVSTILRKSLFREFRMKFLDSNRSNFDEQMIFAEYFSELGPYVAIGRPGEAFESMDLGAAKFYVSDQEWATKVSELIDRAGAIVIEAAESDGLGWELQEVVRRRERVPKTVAKGMPNHKIADVRNRLDTDRSSRRNWSLGRCRGAICEAPWIV
jgi:hypothetical protein